MKPLALGLRVGSGPTRDRFALPIPKRVYSKDRPSLPTCWYLKSLADSTRIPTDPTRSPLTQRELPQTQCESNVSRWNVGRVGSPRVWAHVGHVHFMLFVSNSFALGSQRKCSVRWNMSFTMFTTLQLQVIHFE